MNNDQVKALFKKHRSISKRGLGVQYENNKKCRAFYDEGTMDYVDEIQFEDTNGNKRRAMVKFNKVQAPVDAVAGFFAQNRRQAKYVARPNGTDNQQLYSKNMNSLSDYHRENMNADQLESEQDRDMLIEGYGTTDTDLSYLIGNSTRDPNGEIIKMKLDTDSTYWDPACKNKNLLNSGWAGYWQDYDLMDALDLFQGSEASDFGLADQNGDIDGDDGYTYNPYGGLYDKIKELNNVEWASKERDLVRVYNHQWMQYETYYLADNPLWLTDDPTMALFIKSKLDAIAIGIEDDGPDDIETQDMFKFDPKARRLVFDEATKKEVVKAFGKAIKPVGFKRQVFYTAVISGTHVFKWFKSISQQGFSIKFKTGVYNKTRGHWMGMVNPMMEPADYNNKALTELMFTVAANSKGGVYIEEGAVEDISDFESKQAKTDAVIKVRDGALTQGKIQDKARPAVSTGLEGIIQLSDAALSSAGVDPSFVGDMDDRDQSGILYKRRIRQVLSKFAGYSDSASLYLKEDARLMADMIRVWVQNNNGQWIRVTGSQGAEEFMQISEDAIAAEYDVTIQEAPQTPEDKQQTAQILGTYGDKLIQFNQQAGMAFYAESLQNLSLDGDAKSRLIQVLQPQQQPIDPAMVEKLQQQLQELQSEANQAQVAKTQADAQLSIARAKNMETNNKLIESKVPLSHAQTAKTLEEAARTAAEAHIAENAPESQTSVSV